MKDTAIPGAYGLTPEFEAIVADLQAALSAVSESGAAGPLWYPPVMAASRLERAEYAESFPHLLGAVRAYAEQDRPSDVVLAPAVCYNVYAELADRHLAEFALADASGYCYRHEATSELGRFRTFRMREFIAVGSAGEATAWRDGWIGRCERLLKGFGLEIVVAPATDPFFGPGGRLMRSTQLEQGLKYEFVAKVSADDEGTAIASANCHRDHLGKRFGIQYADQGPAHSSCVAFGLERIALALLHAHGEDRRDWPDLAPAGRR